MTKTPITVSFNFTCAEEARDFFLRVSPLVTQTPNVVPLFGNPLNYAAEQEEANARLRKAMFSAPSVCDMPPAMFPLIPDTEPEPVKSEPVKVKKEAAKEAPKEVPKKKESAPLALTTEDCRKAGKDLMTRVGATAGMHGFTDALHSIGVSRVSDIKPEDRAAFIEYCNKLTSEDIA